MKYLSRGVVAALGLLGASSSWAAWEEHEESSSGFVAELDGEFGGDTVATVNFTDGSSQSVKAGNGITFAVGYHYRPAAWDVDFVSTVGYKFVTTAASNANIGVSRGVFQALALYEPRDSWWVGIGPVYHFSTKFDGDGFVPDLNMGNALGISIQGGWQWIALTYTNIKYTEKSTGRDVKLDGSAVGFSVRWRSR